MHRGHFYRLIGRGDGIQDNKTYGLRGLCFGWGFGAGFGRRSEIGAGPGGAGPGFRILQLSDKIGIVDVRIFY